ncbi:hypothetical protein [Enterobacter ludwigii]|nr:hypothetical protein [Enterobacter ludwigii]
MRSYPQPGERWQHERGWTVTIIRLIEASPSVALVNPEFSCEVLIRHDSDNKLSSCPLAWFQQHYTRLFDAPLYDVHENHPVKWSGQAGGGARLRALNSIFMAGFPHVLSCNRIHEYHYIKRPLWWR